jgi:hypothetical protein
MRNDSTYTIATLPGMLVSRQRRHQSPTPVSLAQRVLVVLP